VVGGSNLGQVFLASTSTSTLDELGDSCQRAKPEGRNFKGVLGPRYATARDLSSNQSPVRAAWNNITDTLNTLLETEDMVNTAATVNRRRRASHEPQLPMPINTTEAQMSHSR